MNYVTFLEKIKEYKNKEDIEGVLDFLENIFYIDSIICIPEEQLSSLAFTKTIESKTKINIGSVQDKSFSDFETLMDCAYDAVNIYSATLSNFQNSESASFDEQYLIGFRSLQRLESLSRAHNINNRFSLTTKNFLNISIENLLSPIEFSSVALSYDAELKLKEYVSVRCEFFTALADLTSSFMNQLEHYKYKYSKFFLSKEKGSYLIMELLTALRDNSVYVENKYVADWPLVEKNIFEAFGLEPKNKSDFTTNIRMRKGNKMKDLQQLINDYNNKTD